MSTLYQELLRSGKRSEQKGSVMRHFLQYHNTEKMGYSAPEAMKSHGFYILTRKKIRPEEVQGQTVWLFSGEGKSPKKHFYLVARFTVSRVSSSPDPNFAYEISGEQGTVFNSIEVTTLDWFKALKKSHSNFSFGFSEIKDPSILKILTKSYS